MSHTRTIRTLWITRKSIDGGFHPPELVQGWDEWSIDENPQGWQEACKEALDAIGSDLSAHRYIDISLNGEALAGAFEPSTISATLQALERTTT
jgi:hypothetical protein